MDALDYAVFECVGLELRQRGRQLSGSFPYGATGVISDRGTVRKERFSKRAFSFAIDDDTRTISLLRGHDFNAALAVRSPQFKTLELVDGDDALSFEASLPPVSQQSTPMRDTLLDIRNGLLSSLSPGFRVPGRDVVPDAESFIPEPGNPGVEIRVISAAILYELSLVHRGVFKQASVELRQEQHGEHATKDDELRRRVMLWL